MAFLDLVSGYLIPRARATNRFLPRAIFWMLIMSEAIRLIPLAFLFKSYGEDHFFILFIFEIK